MKRGRKPKGYNPNDLLRRSGRSRKESFKIKLLNATKGNLATTELLEEVTRLDENENNVITTPVVVVKRKRGRPRKNQVIVKENHKDLLTDVLCNVASPFEHSVPDVSTDVTISGEDSGFMDGSDGSVSPSGLALKLKVKPKKTYTYEPILPPCKVCGAKASGYHFGAITCEACKVFFRRSLTRQTSYHCSNDGDCQILPNRRISCSFCRLKKCGELGMSRDGIQRGRYTVERKTECIRKVKELEILQQEKSVEGFLNEEGSNSCLSFHEPRPDITIKVEVDEETEKFINAIVRADSKSLMVDEPAMKRLLDMQTNYVEYLKLRQSVFGHMESLTAEEYHEVYKNTGIDLGNRRQTFAKCIFSFVTKITKFIEFAKLLPGFLELSMSDQITLLRESMLDWAFLSAYETWDHEKQVFTCPSCHHTWSRDEFDAVKDKRFFFQSFVATSVLKKLKLSKEERSLLKALVIFSPDGSEGMVEDKALVTKYQQRLSDSLMVLLRKNHRLNDSRLAAVFGHIVHSLTEVKDAGIRYKQLMDECLEHFPDIEYPDLFVEILGDEMKLKLDTARAACISQNVSLHSSSTLSTSSGDTPLSPESHMTPDIDNEEPCVWTHEEPVIVQPAYGEQLMNNILPVDGTLLSHLVNTVDNSMDYSTSAPLLETMDGGTDRVLLLAQL